MTTTRKIWQLLKRGRRHVSPVHGFYLGKTNEDLAHHPTTKPLCGCALGTAFVGLHPNADVAWDAHKETDIITGLILAGYSRHRLEELEGYYEGFGNNSVKHSMAETIRWAEEQDI